MKTETNKILSLDAGGVKGIYSILMIKRIEDTYQVNFNQNFGYYVGTSIGSVIATALADGIESKTILSKFLEFKDDLKKGHLYLTAKLFNWIDYLFGTRKMHSVKAKVFIPCYNISGQKHAFFSNGSEFGSFYISDILKAACSDIRIIKPYTPSGTNLQFADAGFFAYDPILFFLRSSPDTFSANLKIMSIGSGIIVNALNDLGKGEIFDTLYDSFLYEQFMTTKFFFETISKLLPIDYLRITEFPITIPYVFTLADIPGLVEKRLLTLNPDDLAHYR